MQPPITACATPTPTERASTFPTTPTTPTPSWRDVQPGDWIRADSADCRHIQGVIEALHDHPEYGLVISLNDTRRATMNWTLLEVRAAA